MQKCSQTTDSDLRYTLTDTISLSLLPVLNTFFLLAHKFTLTSTHTYALWQQQRKLWDISSPVKWISKAVFIKACLTRMLYRTKEDRNSDIHNKVRTWPWDMGPHSHCLCGCFLSSDLWCPQAEVRGPPWAHQQPQQWPIQPHQQHTGDDKQTLWPYCAQEGEQKSPVSALYVCVFIVYLFVLVYKNYNITQFPCGQWRNYNRQQTIHAVCIFNKIT